MRDRIVRYAFVLLLALFIPCSALPRPQRWEIQNPDGHLEEVNGIRILHLQGSAYEMGLQQGTLLRQSLRGLVQNYLYGQLARQGSMAHYELLTQARLLERQMPAAWRLEIQGIAEGAGLSYQDIVLLNTVPELLTQTGKLPPAPSLTFLNSTWPPFSCTGNAFAAWGHATPGGEMIAGYGLDCTETDLIKDHLLMVVRRPTQGNAFVSLCLIGMVGAWAGMNEQRIIAALLHSPSLDVASSGQSLLFILRQVLESAGGLTEALDISLSAERLCGGNLLLGDGKVPEAVVVELSAHRHAILEATAPGSVLACTNHFFDPDLALTQEGLLSAQERTRSQVQLGKLQAMLEVNDGWIGVEKGLAFLGTIHDTQSGANPCLDGSVDQPCPLQSILFYPGNLELWLAQCNARASLGPYVHLDLKPSLLVQARPPFHGYLH